MQKGKNAKIRIVYNSMTINMVIPHIIQQFKRNILISILYLLNGTLLSWKLPSLMTKQMLALLRYTGRIFDGLCCKTIFEEDSVAAIPKGWDLSKHRIHSLSELKDQPFITYSREARRKSFDWHLTLCVVCQVSFLILYKEAESDIAVLVWSRPVWG